MEILQSDGVTSELKMQRKLLSRLLRSVNFMADEEIDVFVELLDEASVKRFLSLYSN